MVELLPTKALQTTPVSGQLVHWYLDLNLVELHVGGSANLPPRLPVSSIVRTAIPAETQELIRKRKRGQSTSNLTCRLIVHLVPGVLETDSV